jgi:hypothetical protein
MASRFHDRILLSRKPLGVVRNAAPFEQTVSHL